MKRYLIMAAIALLIIGLAFVPPPLDPRHRRRSLLLATETPPITLTQTMPTQTESIWNDSGIQSETVGNLTPRVVIPPPPVPSIFAVSPSKDGYPAPIPYP